MAGISLWLFGTAQGRAVMLAVSLFIGLLAGWFLFSSHYESKGYEKCKAEQAKELAAFNVAQARENAQNDLLGSDIAKDAAADAAAVVKGSDTKTASAKEDISNVYKKPPATAPVALGSCVHPVDKRVQDRIDRAIREANR